MITILSEFETGGYEAITVNTEVGFTAGKIRPTSGKFKDQTCQAVFCTLETDDIRFTLDGSTTPSSTTGHRLYAGENLTLTNANDIANFKCIKVTTNASLRVTFKF